MSYLQALPRPVKTAFLVIGALIMAFLLLPLLMFVAVLPFRGGAAAFGLAAKLALLGALGYGAWRAFQAARGLEAQDIVAASRHLAAGGRRLRDVAASAAARVPARPRGDWRALLRRIPLSALLFAFSALVFVLEAVPFPGVLFWMFGAVEWPTVTVNLGFLGIAAEAWGGRVNRLWLLAPLAWFGGYGLFTYEGHSRLAELEAEAARANAGQRLAFDSARDALLIETASPDALLANYDLPVVYGRQPPGRVTTGADGFVLADNATCDIIRLHAERPHAGVSLERLLRDDVSKHLIGCVLRADMTPDRPLFTAQDGKSEDFDEPALWFTLRRIVVSGPSGNVEVQTGAARPYPWFPQPYAGCYLNDGRSIWACGAGFSKAIGHDIPIGPGSTIESVAAALGLKPVSVKERLGAIAHGDVNPYLRRIRARLQAP